MVELDFVTYNVVGDQLLNVSNVAVEVELTTEQQAEYDANGWFIEKPSEDTYTIHCERLNVVKLQQAVDQLYADFSA